MMRSALAVALFIWGCQITPVGVKDMSHFDDDDFLGSDEEILQASGDELDFAETIARINPVADQLQHFANMRNLKQAMNNAKAPAVSTNPASVLHGSLGNQVSVTTGQRVQVVNWNGDDSETTDLTVTLFPISRVSDVTQPIGIRAFGIVQFGTRGSLATVEVDIGKGCQFTVSGSSITVQVALDTISVLPPTITDTVFLSGMLSFKPILRTQQITRTLYADLTGSFGTFQVPNFAKSVSLWKEDYTAAILMEFLDSSGATRYKYTIAAGPSVGKLFEPVPLGGDIYQIRLSYVGGIGPNDNMDLIFNLGI
jgi:hypothetical protein